MFSFLKNKIKKTYGFGKKIFLVIAVYVVIISLFTHFFNKNKPVVIQDPIKKNRAEIYKILNDPELKKTKEGKITVAIYKAVICGTIGEACTNNPDDGDKNFKNSLIGKVSNILVSPYTHPPASGVMWAYNGLQSAGFVPQTYAAEGFGFAVIRPYANLWKIFRDIAYMFLVLVIVALGFMIMFRMKLNPQTVISVENALPRIVIALILITFSFAIAGFMIDLMYVSIVLIVSILSNGSTYFNATEFQNEFIGANTGKLFKDVTLQTDFIKFGGAGGIIESLGGALLGLFPWQLTVVLRLIVGALTLFVLVNPLDVGFLKHISDAFDNWHIEGTAAGFGGAFSPGGFLGAIFGTAVNVFIFSIVIILGMYIIFPILLWVILVGTFIMICFRIFALLFMSYIKLLLNIILSPFLLMFEAIPGKSPFTSWIKNIFGYLMAFPITIAVFLVGYIIVNSSLPAGYSEMHLPYLWGINSNAFKILIATGLIFLIPDLVKTAKEALGIKELPINLGIGTYFGGVGTVAGGTMGIMSQFSTFSLGLQGMSTIKKMLIPKKDEEAATDSLTRPRVSALEKPKGQG